MDAVISAGGRGTRLGEPAREIPKCLVPVAGIPILERQIEELARSGIRKVWLLTGHLGELIEERLASRTWPLITEVLREEKPLGTAGGLAALKGRIGEPFIFLYGDLVLSMDFRRMLAFHEAAKAAITLLAHPNSHPYDSDLLLVGPCDTLVGITRKGEARLFDYSNLVNAGAYILSPAVLESVEAGIKQDFEKDILPRFLAGGRARAYRTPEFVKDMGTPERLAEVEAAILSGAVEARRLSFPQKAIFLDRDGTINRYVDLLCRPEQIELLPGSAQAIRAINESGCYRSSSAISRWWPGGLCSMDDVEETHRRMETLLGAQGAFVDDIRFCPHHPDSGFPGEVPEFKMT